METAFQAGIILGRITQLCVDRGIVSTGAGIALEDLLALFTEDLSSLPVSVMTRMTINDEIHSLAGALAEYKKDQRLNTDDARIMIRLVSRWTDMILDEFINHAQSDNVSGPISEKRCKTTQKGPEVPILPRPDHENQDSHHSIPGDTREIISGSHDRLGNRE